MTRIRLIFAALALSAVTAAAQTSAPSGPWRVERARRGDTAVVRTLGGSTWSSIQLVEELRIGSKEGDGPEAFGALTGFALFPNGTIAVFDPSIPALNLFDSSGKHLRTLGRSGSGPGEYRDQVTALAVDRNGVILMHDLRNARINRWQQDGSALPAWRWSSSMMLVSFKHGLLVDTTGHTYIPVIMERPEPGKDLKRGFVRLDPNGAVVDTVRRPAIAGPDEPPLVIFSPHKHWFLTRAGREVSGFSGAYAITLAGPGRGAVRIERVIPQLALEPDERKNHQEITEARTTSGRMGSQPGPTPRVPAVKPFFSQLHSDLDGRLWVQLYGKGERYDSPPPPKQPGMPELPPLRWRERMVWDLFEPDGTYLGQLELPKLAQLAEAKGDRLWAIERGEDGEQYIVRYRMSRGR